MLGRVTAPTISRLEVAERAEVLSSSATIAASSSASSAHSFVSPVACCL